LIRCRRLDSRCTKYVFSRFSAIGLFDLPTYVLKHSQYFTVNDVYTDFIYCYKLCACPCTHFKKDYAIKEIYSRNYYIILTNRDIT